MKEAIAVVYMPFRVEKVRYMKSELQLELLYSEVIQGFVVTSLKSKIVKQKI